MNSQTAQRLAAALTTAAGFAAWTTYFPLGTKYLGTLVCGLLALALLRTGGTPFARWGIPAIALPARLMLACCLWLFLSATWSSAPPADIASHFWHYGRMLFLPLIAMACAPQVASRALRHFSITSAAVGVLVIANSATLLPWPGSALWSSTITANGNQRIVTSLLLAIGAALAVVECSAPLRHWRARVLWGSVAVLAALGLALQDRRTGMVTLPLLLLVLALSRQRSGWRSWATVGAVVAAAFLVWSQADGVRTRFAEGLAELRTYESTGPVATSWGMRLRMTEITIDMIQSKPLLGHGLGSWLTQWHKSAHGGPLLQAQLSPHNDYLLIAAQSGLPGLALWLATLAAFLASAWRAGRAGDTALLLWTAIAWASLFNVALRDATIAMPLVLLGGLAVAASREDDAARSPEFVS